MPPEPAADDNQAQAQLLWNGITEILSHCAPQRIGKQIKIVLEPADEEKFLTLFARFSPPVLIGGIKFFLERPIIKSATEVISRGNSEPLSLQALGREVGVFEYQLSAPARDFLFPLVRASSLSEAEIKTIYRIFAAEIEEKLRPATKTLPDIDQLCATIEQARYPQYFLMSPPVHSGIDFHDHSGNSQSFQLAATSINNRYCWEMVKMAIEAAGGTVLVVDGSKNAVRASFTRDQTIILQDSVIVTGFRKDRKLQSEAKLGINPLLFRREMNALLEKLGLSNFKQLPNVHIDGGNILTHPIGRMELVFVGGTDGASLTSAYQHLRPVLRENSLLPVAIAEKHAHTIYHLDLAMSINRGKFMLFSDAIAFDFQRKIIEQVADGHLISVGEEDAYRGANNNVLVGNNLILPFAGAALQAEISRHGFRPVTPESLGVPSGSFSYGAAHAHCLTLEIPASRLSASGKAEVKRMLMAQRENQR